MKTHTFKTNIEDDIKLKSATSSVFADKRIAMWELDEDHPEKILMVRGNIEEADVVKLLEKAGFKATPVKQENI